LDKVKSSFFFPVTANIEFQDIQDSASAINNRLGEVIIGKIKERPDYNPNRRYKIGFVAFSSPELPLDENFDKGTESKRLLEIAKLMSLMPYEKK
jgi:hypothetical protein